MIKIEIQDPVYAKVTTGIKEVKALLSYESVFYRQGQFRKVRTDYKKSVVSRGGLFPIGLIPRIRKHCKKYKIELKVGVPPISNKIIPKHIEPNIKGITFRSDQLKAIKSTIKKLAGQIIAPTGTGKTVTAAGIISSFPDTKVVFLAHTKDLVYQAYDEFKKFGLTDIGMYTGTDKNLSASIVVATRQSFVKVVEKVGHEFDILIIDECHHITSEKGQYGKILAYCPAPIRIGFTATQNKEQQAMLTTEGFLGPIIAELTWEEGADMEILSEPKVHLIRIPDDNKIKAIGSYKKAYEKGIVSNNRYNRVIINTIKEYNERGESVLVFVTREEHGLVLQKLAERVLNVKVPFVYGKTDSKRRRIIKNRLEKKKFLCVITSVIWQEGINIPSLDAVANAGQGKDEKKVLQLAGRALRRTEDKTVVHIIDFFNPNHKTFIDHFGRRLCIYFDKGWI